MNIINISSIFLGCIKTTAQLLSPSRKLKCMLITGNIYVSLYAKIIQRLRLPLTSWVSVHNIEVEAMMRPRAKLQTTFLGIEREVFHLDSTDALRDGREVIRDVTGTSHIYAVVFSTREHYLISRAV